jgi:hypothetical protein
MTKGYYWQIPPPYEIWTGKKSLSWTLRVLGGKGIWVMSSLFF